MKKIILIPLVIISISNLSAQLEWAPYGAKWYYSYPNPGGIIAYNEIKYIGDTTIDNIECKILLKNRYLWDNYFNKIDINKLGYEYTYLKDSVVYIHTNNKFDTLYNFRGKIGDSWILYCYSSSGICDSNAIVTVIDTGHVIINEKKLKLLLIKYNYGYVNGKLKYTIQDTIIERIGSLNSYILPWDIYNEMLDANEGGPLRCYSDNNFQHIPALMEIVIT